MELPDFISDNIAILLVALVVLITVVLFLAQKLLGSKSGTSTAVTSAVKPNTPTEDKQLQQSQAAKKFRKKLQEISLDLDKN